MVNTAEVVIGNVQAQLILNSIFFPCFIRLSKTYTPDLVSQKCNFHITLDADKNGSNADENESMLEIFLGRMKHGRNLCS